MGTYITLTCDEQQDGLAVTSVVEGATCTYYINATSMYACGTQANGTQSTPSNSVSVSVSSSVTPSISASRSVSGSQGSSPSPSASGSQTPSVSPSQSITPTMTPTTSMTASVSATQSSGAPASEGGSIWYWWVLATVGCFAIGIIVGVALGF